jgi:serine/threonine protein kinase
MGTSQRAARVISTLPGEDSVPPASSEVVLVEHDLLRVGDVLGDTFEVCGKLGEGGMGQVYEAYDRRLGRRVAIKVARPHSAVSVSGEARALAVLRGHPSIATVHALGVHAGMEYAVMDLIRGPTLQAYLDRHRADGTLASTDEIAEIGAAIAEGLAVVHEAGMAHRDVKPGNVILAPGNRAVITDFGIFRPECDASRLECDPSSPDVVWGTPDYMAPEVACGVFAPGELFLADVYALGVVLFELLTGVLPFQGSETSVLWKHVHQPIPDPGVQRPDTPRDLAALVRGMMAKAPRARPQSMREIAWQLRHPRSEPSRRFSTVIAEDNTATCTILEMLVSEGVPDADIRVARDGLVALDMVLRQPPQLLVVDLHLPVLSGVELCKRLAESDLAKRCVIVGTSALAEAGELEVLRRSGVRFLPKGEACATQLPLIARTARVRSARR